MCENRLKSDVLQESIFMLILFFTMQSVSAFFLSFLIQIVVIHSFDAHVHGIY